MSYQPYYCVQCKAPLSLRNRVDVTHAWCPKCKTVVSISYFRSLLLMLGTAIAVMLFFFLAIRILP